MPRGWYAGPRTVIERYHDVLKSGCLVEDLPRETRGPLYHGARPGGMAGLYVTPTHRTDVPDTPVTLQAVIRMAQPGGFLGPTTRR